MFKREIRVLGLAFAPVSKRRVIIIGVVFRGRLWLDGVFSVLLKPPTDDIDKNISRAIRRSRQYSQLQAVFVSDISTSKQLKLDSAKLAQKVKLPIIQISQKPPGRSAGQDERNVILHGKRFFVHLNGIAPKDTKELLSITSSPESNIPEALRVAKMIANQAFCLLSVGHNEKL